jgi:hypothetical protein
VAQINPNPCLESGITETLTLRNIPCCGKVTTTPGWPEFSKCFLIAIARPDYSPDQVTTGHLAQGGSTFRLAPSFRWWKLSACSLLLSRLGHGPTGLMPGSRLLH